MTAPAVTEYGPQDSIDEKEKLESPGASTIAPLSDAPVKDWTDAEEAAVRRKLDVLVMPLLMLGFFVFQLERGNISNALTSSLLKDVGIDQTQFNTGQGLLYLGIVLLEIPSQVVLQRVGPARWISLQVLAFGLVGTFQAWMHNYGSYLATRILLGCVESGYIPGGLFTISRFYKRDELAKRNAAFFLGSGLASAVTGLFAYGILRMEGLHGYAGWQWLFIIEGCLAIGIAIFFFLLLPASPESPAPFLFPRMPYFTERQKYILRTRVVLDDANKAQSARYIGVKAIVRTVTNPRIWPHVLLAVSLIAPTAAMGTYTPTLIRSFGFDTLKANALSSVAGWVGLVTTFAFGVLSDKTGRRGLSCIAAVACFWVFWVAFQQVSLGTDKWAKYALIVLVQGFNAAYHPLNASWLSLNQITPQERSIAMAMFVSAANTGAAIGSQLLRKDDAPLYRRGFRVCVALVSFGLLTAICQHVQYRWSNRRLDQERQELSIDSEKGGNVDETVRKLYVI
ncbi:uncharacterized protein JCM10292_001431 [Rhodotorula paludigena]|uniref:uncharacterized protein n=1 Tax=Rhodotorula paludigena TaxID=86838 RepID=UPI003173AAD7